MKKFLFVCSFFFLFQQVFSKDKSERAAYAFDPNYIDTYYDDLIVRLYSANRNNFIQFNDLDQEQRLKYRSNDYLTLGAGINYKWFGINLGTKIQPFSNDDRRFGKTTTFGIQTYIYARRFTIDVMAFETKGYYLSGSDDGLLGNETGEYYQRNNMKTKYYGANLNYIQNYRRFSYKAAFKQNELQKRSAGSLIFGGGFYVLNVDDDQPLIPVEIDADYYRDWRFLKAITSYTFNANLGYAYSWVPHKNWVITGSYRFSLGVQHNIWHVDENPDQSQYKINRSAVVRVSAGHHFPGFYIGASYVRYQQNSSMQINSLDILNGTNFIEFTISKRIKL